MSGRNKYRPHLLVLPEDDANREIADGFLLHPKLDQCSIQVLPPADGWLKVLKEFADDHVSDMRRYANRNLLLVIDFDGDTKRLQFVKAKIPKDLKDRVFVLGVLSEPERLKNLLGKHFEAIGNDLAQDCSENEYSAWGCQLLV